MKRWTLNIEEKSQNKIRYMWNMLSIKEFYDLVDPQHIDLDCINLMSRTMTDSLILNNEYKYLLGILNKYYSYIVKNNAYLLECVKTINSGATRWLLYDMLEDSVPFESNVHYPLRDYSVYDTPTDSIRHYKVRREK